MSDTADHGPRAGCVAASCGLSDPFNCPFFIPRREPDAKALCEHQYNHLRRMADADRFYCIYCLHLQDVA